MKTLLALLLMMAGGLLSLQAHAVVCTDVLAVEDSGRDTDGDGLTDYQECAGIRTVGNSPVDFPWCGSAGTDGVLPTRDRCVDPDSRDLFVIFVPAKSAPSLLPQGFNAFVPVSAYGVNFMGLNALRLAVHVLTEDQAGLNRDVTNAVLNLPVQKAVRVAESLDVSGTILGNCQYGTPLGLDGCVVYTQRTKNFIASTCGSAKVFTPGGVESTQDQVLLAYSTFLILHEAGHSLGGLTSEYDSRFGGYHYKSGSGLLMDQSVTYTVKSGKCTFYIGPNWNQTLDPPAVRLK